MPHGCLKRLGSCQTWLWCLHAACARAGVVPLYYILVIALKILRAPLEETHSRDALRNLAQCRPRTTKKQSTDDDIIHKCKVHQHVKLHARTHTGVHTQPDAGTHASTSDCAYLGTHGVDQDMFVHTCTIAVNIPSDMWFVCVQVRIVQ